jgi:hypothetical protein
MSDFDMLTGLWHVVHVGYLTKEFVLICTKTTAKNVNNSYKFVLSLYMDLWDWGE